MLSRGVVVIGNFDGVHRGHQAVLGRAKQEDEGPLVVVTFWPHPLSIVAPDRAPKLLSDLRTRIDLLKAAGADEVRVVRFNRDVASWTPAEFVERIVEPLQPNRVVVGENFRFGVRASGDVNTLRDLGEGRFEVTGLGLLRVEDVTTCSTFIRAALDVGEVAEAAQHLGRDFRFRGTVVMGDQRGRELGFPTANLIVPSELAVPADGVYAGYLSRLDDPGARRMPAAISVGTNPTFDGEDRRVETYVLDRADLELYGVEVVVDFTGRLRDQVKFDGVEPLIAQMSVDVNQTRQILSGGTGQLDCPAQSAAVG